MAEPQPDWPANTVVTGFPFYDRRDYHGETEVAKDLLAFLDAGLRDVRNAIHLDRDAHAVPVHGRLFIELVLEVHDQAIADARLDQRTGDAAVVGPGMHRLAVDLHVGKLRDHVDLDDLRIGIAIGQFVELDAIGPPRGRERLRSG